MPKKSSGRGGVPKTAEARARVLAGAIAGGTATAKRGAEYYREIGRMGGFAGKGIPRKRKAKAEPADVVEPIVSVPSVVHAARSAALASLDAILGEMGDC